MATKPNKPTRKRKGRRARLFSGCLFIFTAFLLLAIIIGGIGVWKLTKTIQQFSQELALENLMIDTPRETTKILARDGSLLAELFVENREYAELRNIPDMLQLAVISTEDAEFFTHPGLNFRRMVAAAMADIQSRSLNQGASTITQQLAKILFLSPEKKVERKIKEAILAFWLEKHYTKEEILEHYLNRMYFGHGAYGVKAAAKIFFDKKMDELSIAECAVLAGVLQSPSRLSPFINLDAAVKRRALVLKRMLATNSITEAQYRSAMEEPLRVRKGYSNDPKKNFKHPYFVTYVISLLQNEDSGFPLHFSLDELYGNGLRIVTTLDPDMQTAAEKAVAEGIAKANKEMSKVHIEQGALVALDPNTGEIMSMVGGLDFYENEFNRAWQAKRQPGSAFKPFVYLTALRLGYSMENPVVDSKVCFPMENQPPYCPKNYDQKFKGKTTFAYALQFSKNVPTVKVANTVGVNEIIDTAREMGVTSELYPYLSLALGACEVTPLELISAYAPLANGGHKIESAAIKKIYDSSGAQLYFWKPKVGKKVVGDYALSQIIPVMKSVITGGTGARAKIDRPAIGKTGTTSNHMDAWFIGLTPDLAAAVWVGNDRDLAMGSNVQGGRVPAPIWKAFMDQALKKIKDPKIEFDVPPISGRPSRIYSEEGMKADEDAVVGKEKLHPSEVGQINADGFLEVGPTFVEDSEWFQSGTSNESDGLPKRSQPSLQPVEEEDDLLGAPGGQ